MADVKLPGVGPVNKKALLIGGGVAVLVTGFLWWRKRSTPAPTPPTDTTGTTDTSGTDSGMAGGGGGSWGGSGGITGPSIPTTIVPTTNPQWTAQVMQLLGGVVDPTLLSSALGKYLTGSAVNDAETAIIDQAIAAAGYPPVSGPTGYPPAIRTQPSGGQPPPPPPPPPVPTPTPTPPPGPKVGHTTVIDGKSLTELLGFFNMTQAEFEALNPGIQSVYRWYQAGKGYAPGNVKRPGDIVALDVGPVPRVVFVYGGW